MVAPFFAFSWSAKSRIEILSLDNKTHKMRINKNQSHAISGNKSDEHVQENSQGEIDEEGELVGRNKKTDHIF